MLPLKRLHCTGYTALIRLASIRTLVALLIFGWCTFFLSRVFPDSKNRWCCYCFMLCTVAFTLILWSAYTTVAKHSYETYTPFVSKSFGFLVVVRFFLNKNKIKCTFSVGWFTQSLGESCVAWEKMQLSIKNSLKNTRLLNWLRCNNNSWRTFVRDEINSLHRWRKDEH